MGAPRLTTGPAFLQQAINDLATHVDSVTPMGPGVTDSATGKGRYIAGTAAARAGGATPIEFALYDASVGTTLKVGVKFGNFSAYRTTDGLDSYPTSDYTSASNYKYEFSVSGVGSVWIKFTNDLSGDYDKLSGVTMGNGATVPTASATAGYLTLGSYNVTGTPSKVVILSGSQGIGNQMYNFANGAHVWGPL